MQGGKRKLTSWNLFVKKIFAEGKSKNKNYSFKNALSDASRRKGEMGKMSVVRHSKKSRKSSRKTRKHRK